MKWGSGKDEVELSRQTRSEGKGISKPRERCVLSTEARSGGWMGDASPADVWRSRHLGIAQGGVSRRLVVPWRSLFPSLLSLPHGFTTGHVWFLRKKGFSVRVAVLSYTLLTRDLGLQHLLTERCGFEPKLLQCTVDSGPREGDRSQELRAVASPLGHARESPPALDTGDDSGALALGILIEQARGGLTQ